MTLKIIDNDASAVARIRAKISFIGMLLLSCALLPGFFQPVKAAPGEPEKKPAGYAPYIIVFTPINNNAIAASGVEDQVQVTVIDQATGLPVPNSAITIRLDNNVSVDNKTTDGSGNFVIKLTGDEVGQTIIHVKVAGQATSYDYTFTYIAGTPSSSGSGTQLIVDVPAAPDNGNTPATIHAHIENQYGADYPGLPVTFTIVGGGASGTAVVTVVNATTDVNGDAYINITNLKPGDVIFTATYTYGGAQVPITNNSPATVTFVATPDPTNPATQLIVDVPTAAVGGTTTIHAHIVGDNGLPLAGSKVVFTMTGGTASGTAGVTIVGTGYTDANGDAYINITDSKPGTVVFTATAQNLLNTTTYPIVFGSPATVTFTSVTPDPTNPATQLIVDVPQAAAGGGITTIHAHVVGDDGLPLAGSRVVFTKTGTGTADGTAVVTIVGTGYTDANGDAYINITDPNVGTVIFTATAQSLVNATTYPIVNGSPATVTFVTPPPDPGNPATALIVDVPSVLANGQDKAVIRAHIVGTDGNVQAGVSVVFTISGGSAAGGAMVTVVNGTTDANGDAVIDISNFSLGDVSFTATAKDPVTGTIYPITNGSPATVNFVAGNPVPGDPSGGGSGGTPPSGGGVPPGSGDGGGSGGSGSNPGGGNGNNGNPADNHGFTLLFVRQDYQLGDGKGQDSVIALVTDGLPKPHALKGVEVDFFIQASPLAAGTATATAQFVGNPIQVLTDDSGYARIAITSTKPGTVFVNGVLHSQNVLIDGSYQIVTFTNKPDVNNPLTALSVVIYEALADGSQQTEVKAHIVDLDGNIMPGEEVTFKIDSGSGTIVTPQPVLTDGNGDAYIFITSKTPGVVNITATVGGQSIIYGSPAMVKFAPINIYVPKVFTPNNDGTNDVLKPILVGISAFHYFSVYNRWGNLIYTTQDPNQGWDGTFKGVAQPVETYLWIAEGIDVTGKKIVQKGMTSLVR